MSDRGEHCGISPTAQWTAAWAGAAGLGIANGVARDLLYTDRVGDRAAHQISTGTLIAALASYSRLLQRRWPIPNARTAWTIGAIWLSATVAFEFVFGHYIAGESWGSLARNYDPRDGRVWGLVPISMAVLPAVARRLGSNR
jgi:hypothetical protein